MLKDFTTAIRPALVLTALFALLLGVAYPALLTAIGQALFPAQANGSLIREQGRIVGSELIGQAFASPRYFHGRPSAAGKGYDPTASGGSNLGPASRALVARVKSDLAVLGPVRHGTVPADLVTASASGLDPHISPEAAEAQVARVAAARAMSARQISGLVKQQTEMPLLGILGEPRVNVLLLNRALDRLHLAGAQAAR